MGGRELLFLQIFCVLRRKKFRRGEGERKEGEGRRGEMALVGQVCLLAGLGKAEDKGKAEMVRVIRNGSSEMVRVSSSSKIIHHKWFI